MLRYNKKYVQTFVQNLLLQNEKGAYALMFSYLFQEDEIFCKYVHKKINELCEEDDCSSLAEMVAGFNEFYLEKKKEGRFKKSRG